MKWYSFIGDKPIESLTKAEKQELETAVIDKIASFSFKVHKTTPKKEVRHEEKVI